MAHIRFYSGIDLIDTLSVLSANLDFNRDRTAAEAQDRANECDSEIERQRAITTASARATPGHGAAAEVKETDMARSNSLTGWIDGALPARDDGSLAIVELRAGATVDGEDHCDLPIIVARWSSKLQTTGGAHRVEYADVLRYIDIAA